MGKSEIGPATLVVAVLAGALALMLLPGPFTWLTSMGGLTLLLILLSYDQHGHRSVFQSLSFSAVCGLCLMLISAIVFQLLGKHGEIPSADGRLSGEWLPLTWACATVLFWIVDWLRMGARETFWGQPGIGAIPSHRSLIPEFPASPPADPVSTASEEPRPQLVPVEAARPVKPDSPPVLVRPGKEMMIYVNLVGEGLNVLRTVRAEHLGRDFYKIIDVMPEGETWEYQPGQVVRCKKKSLSHGKGLVAVEEAPRA